MKRFFLFLLMMLCLLSACHAPAPDVSEPDEAEVSSEESLELSSEEETSAEPEPTELTDIHALEEGITYVARMRELFTFRSEDPQYRMIQGACFDGETYYISAIRGMSDGSEQVRILKLDAEGKTIAESNPLLLDHANNITYNSRLNRLVVSHCHSPDNHYYRYSLVDPDRLKITQTADLPYPFYSMAYCEEKDMYASGEWSGEFVDTWDGDMTPVLHVAVECPASLSQGVFCDAQGIYFVRSAQNGAASEIRIYDWECQLTRRIELLTPSGNIEPESINIVGQTVYVVAFDHSRGCGVSYTLFFETAETE